MNLKIKIALQQDISKIISVAEKVWKQHYAPILSKEQIDYMYEKTYSVEALEEQMKSGITYFLCFLDDLPIGYMAYYIKDDGYIYLSKLYVDISKQKIGAGKLLYDTLEKIANKNNCEYIELNVHRKNPSMYFYKKVGFELHENVNLAFGKYNLCDYVLRKYLKP